MSTRRKQTMFTTSTQVHELKTGDAIVVYSNGEKTIRKVASVDFSNNGMYVVIFTNGSRMIVNGYERYSVVAA
jgi:hypothetical protein